MDFATSAADFLSLYHAINGRFLTDRNFFEEDCYNSFRYFLKSTNVTVQLRNVRTMRFEIFFEKAIFEKTSSKIAVDRNAHFC